jgi:hypothetical protein
VADIGENRDQEASAKAAEVAAAGVAVRWHFVGQLQRRKCRSVVGYADLVHSVDGVKLADALADAAATTGTAPRRTGAGEPRRRPGPGRRVASGRGAGRMPTASSTAWSPRSQRSRPFDYGGDGDGTVCVWILTRRSPRWPRCPRDCVSDIRPPR